MLDKIFKRPHHQLLLLVGVGIIAFNAGFIGWLEFYEKYDWINTGIGLNFGVWTVISSFLFNYRFHKYSVYAQLIAAGFIFIISMYVAMSRNILMDRITEKFIEDHLGSGDDMKPDSTFEETQRSLICCGMNGPIDFNDTRDAVPSSCCGHLKGFCDIYKANPKGCYKPIYIRYKTIETERGLINFLGRIPLLLFAAYLHRRKEHELRE